jgi:protein gp37/ParB-like chromosome segregation protein Spo0J
MRLIPLTILEPHPQNPRLQPREDVVEQIAAHIAVKSEFDEAHALLVRPTEAGFQIVSGHHRKLAAERAGLIAVPCWVREMSDDDAYMALVTSNAQSELTPLERGLHALKSSMGVREYARETGRKHDQVVRERQAAEVVAHATSEPKAMEGYTRHLADIHSAPKWLWPALVERLLAEGWTVDATRKQVDRFKNMPAVKEEWLNRELIANDLVSGKLNMRQLRAAIDYAAQVKLSNAYRQALLKALWERRPSSPSAIREVCSKWEDAQAEEDRRAREEEVAKQREGEAAAARTAALKNSCSLTIWKELSPAERAKLMEPDGSAASFNKQENDAIEWAQWSWNPVTGCLHDCPYCYARDIANQAKMEKFYPSGFEPSIRARVLLAPRGRKPPPQAATDTRYRNVFTCSMADLFGRWVPQEWIEAVFAEVRSAPDWNFLFLTKFPKRMAEFDIPENAWMGTTVDLQARVPAAEAAFAKVKSGVRWLSVEPMLEPIRFNRLDLFQWIVIGGASASSKTPEWSPHFEWVADLVSQARAAGTKVHFKTNLKMPRILEMPFDAPIPKEETELPAVFRYLGKEPRAA